MNKASEMKQETVADIIGGSALRLEQVIIGVEATKYLLVDSAAWLEVEAANEQMRKAMANLDKAALRLKFADNYQKHVSDETANNG